MTRTNSATSRARRPLLLAALAALAAAEGARAADAPAPGQEFLQFVRARAAALRADDAPPRSLDDWNARRPVVRARLAEALGTVPDAPAPLEPQTHGELDRDGYRVEKVTFQTLPGVRMTANLYVPDAPGRHAAILAVHGHWRGAKQDPVVQSRCIGAAKLGFVVLVVDAFGAGERGVGTALGEYHGEMTAATLLPSGTPLAGLQVYENRRAVDYLRSRPEVDPDRIGITGASGGGNQTMYAGALIDEPQGRRAGLLGRQLPGVPRDRLLHVRGGPRRPDVHRGVGRARPVRPAGPRASSTPPRTPSSSPSPRRRRPSRAWTPIYKLYGSPTTSGTPIFESGHDYNRAMREAMYGWFTPPPQGRRRRRPDRRAGDQDRRPRDAPLLPRRHAARRLRHPPPFRRGRRPEAPRGEGRSRRRRLLEARGRGPAEDPRDEDASAGSPRSRRARGRRSTAPAMAHSSSARNRGSASRPTSCPEPRPTRPVPC